MFNCIPKLKFSVAPLFFLGTHVASHVKTCFAVWSSQTRKTSFTQATLILSLHLHFNDWNPDTIQAPQNPSTIHHIPYHHPPKHCRHLLTDITPLGRRHSWAHTAYLPTATNPIWKPPSRQPPISSNDHRIDGHRSPMQWQHLSRKC